ncbi:MAG: gamma-glutamylcyclotransferase family protein [Gammaproteobacteria bacterium]|nr:gamma-glutamylcyclotransferase family protein [Gammaproteobacteria bacterium]
MERLFVYGTLAPGRPNHVVLEQIPGYWEKATLKGNLLDEGWGSEFGCPGIVPSEDGEEVEGYVFSSDHLRNHWPMLDEYEGTGYRRVPVLVKVESGEKIEACVYALNHAT